jgi:DNA-binding CsgD family transcriptional regulator
MTDGLRGTDLGWPDASLLVVSVPAAGSRRPLAPPGASRGARRRLTAAEREVARLVGMGASNQETARARGASGRTIANQLASIFRKLGVGSRFELAALLPDLEGL